ncbi:unnamed protein product [Mycena citricolor]|uniref:N-acetyltransferase domain-containing protein n=1 Tax=Mycena citricolor TaxID=2018698 RepID=A0AAD2HM29_9AGAR|nr:unnamed protein product [Mycena citricolor]
MLGKPVHFSLVVNSTPSMGDFEIYSIAQPASDPDITKYIGLRLLALKTNPEAFGSTYDRESKEPFEEFRKRLNVKGRQTFVARRTVQGGGEEWVGTASILAPEMLDELQGGYRHVLVGMWVHADYRRNGLAKRLINAGREWVRISTQGLPEEKRRLTLEVHGHNSAASALYEALGFMQDEGKCNDPTRIPMFVIAK